LQTYEKGKSPQRIAASDGQGFSFRITPELGATRKESNDQRQQVGLRQKLTVGHLEIYSQ